MRSAKALATNDNLVVEIRLSKRVDRHNPRIEVLLTALPLASIQLYEVKRRTVPPASSRRTAAETPAAESPQSGRVSNPFSLGVREHYARPGPSVNKFSAWPSMGNARCRSAQTPRAGTPAAHLESTRLATFTDKLALGKTSWLLAASTKRWNRPMLCPAVHRPSLSWLLMGHRLPRAIMKSFQRFSLNIAVVLHYGTGAGRILEHADTVLPRRRSLYDIRGTASPGGRRGTGNAPDYHGIPESAATEPASRTRAVIAPVHCLTGV